MTETVAEARKIYASMLRSGAARPRTRTRFDSGKKGVKKEGSFANWNRVRKHALAEAVQMCETPPRKPSELQTESAVKERCFQRQNALKRKAEAMVDGLLLTDEIGQEKKRILVECSLDFDKTKYPVGPPESDWSSLVLSEVRKATSARSEGKAPRTQRHFFDPGHH